MMFHNGTNFGIKRRLDVDVLVYGDLVTTEPCNFRAMIFRIILSYYVRCVRSILILFIRF